MVPLPDAEFWLKTLTPWAAIVGAVTGAIGLGLGIYNLVLARKSHRVKVVIECSLGGSNVGKAEGGEPIPQDRWLTIKIINCSYFPITVDRVGLSIRKRRLARSKLFTVPLRKDVFTKQLRIESRDATEVKLYLGRRSRFEKSRSFEYLSQHTEEQIVGAFAHLPTGQTFVGGREDARAALREMRQVFEYFTEHQLHHTKQ